MKTTLNNSFFANIKKAATDKIGYEILQDHISYYRNRQRSAKTQFIDWESVRNRAAFIRAKGIRNAEKYLNDFEYNFIKHNGKVIWAMNEDDANLAILEILKTSDAKTILATHSATLNEIGFKSNLPRHVTITETAMFDFIEQNIDNNQLDLLRIHDRDLAEKVAVNFQNDITLNKTSVVRLAESSMRNIFFDADVVITGANFLVADIGAVSLSENEGNICRASAFAKTHIVVAGYDKIIPSVQDIETLWTMFACSGDGSLLTAYNHLFLGARTDLENDGSHTMIVIIINNGRDKVLKTKEQQKILYCIHCNACKYRCPVWQTVGDKCYNAPYQGPFGAVFFPLLNDPVKYSYLSYFSSISDRIQQDCPIKIPLNELILANRAKFTKDNSNNKSLLINILIKKSLLFFCYRNMMNINNKYKKKAARHCIKKHHLPAFAKKTFNEWYKEHNSNM